MTHDATTLLLRVFPFLAGAVLAYLWMVLIIIQTPRDRWNFLTTSLVCFLFAAASYFLALASGNSQVWKPPIGVYDTLRIILLLAAVIGTPVTYGYIKRAIAARRQGLTTPQNVYIDPKNDTATDGMP